MVRNDASSPSNSMVPSNVPWGYTPLSTFMRVDLPAPFSPQMAWTWPRSTSMVTPSRARTPLKSFVMSRIVRMVDIAYRFRFLCSSDQG
jgi:hypothetical protein